MTKLLVLLVVCCFSVYAQNQEQYQLPSKLKEVCYEEGEDWIEDPLTERSAYEATVVHGVTQNTNSFCGVASAVMILNSLQVDAPIDEDHGFPYFNQANFFSKEVEDVVPATQVLAQGFTLDQLGRALQTWEYGAYDDEDDKPNNRAFLVEDVVHASEVDEDDFRLQVRNHMASQRARMIVNFNRELIGQGVDLGHISPIVAFNEMEDAVLVFDVARYKYPCPTYWVPIDLLYGAMRSEDPVSGKTRGYIIIDDPRGHNDSSSGDDEIPWYVILVVSLGATSYICFTFIAIVLICASLLTVIKRRGKRTRPDVAI